jgi:hypothetical protein
VEHRSAILNLPNEVPIGQNADHRDIARFESPTDRNYRPVASRLQKFHDDIANKEVNSNFRQVTVDLAQSGRRTKHIFGLLVTKADFFAETTSIFEIPVSLGRIFHGRDSLLKEIDDFFVTSSFRKQQLSFAICGLGMSIRPTVALRTLCPSHFADPAKVAAARRRLQFNSLAAIAHGTNPRYFCSTRRLRLP